MQAGRKSAWQFEWVYPHPKRIVPSVEFRPLGIEAEPESLELPIREIKDESV